MKVALFGTKGLDVIQVKPLGCVFHVKEYEV